MESIHLGSEARFLCGVELGVAASELHELVQVLGRRAPKPPILRAQLGDPGGVQGIAIVLAELVLEQERDHVDEILLGDLDDLQLGEEQFGQRQRGRVDLKPVLQRYGVAEVELFVEHVDMHAAGGAAKYRARTLGDDEHLTIFDIAEARQDLMQFTRLFLAPGEVYVAIDPVDAGEGGMVRTAPQDGHRSHQA